MTDAVYGAQRLVNFDGDAGGQLAVTLYGADGTAQSGPSTWKDLSAVTITTIATVWTPASGKTIRLLGGTISVSAVMNVLFEDNSAAAANFVFRTPKLLADTPYTFDLGGSGKLLAAAENVLKATGSAGGTITGTLYGCEV